MRTRALSLSLSCVRVRVWGQDMETQRAGRCANRLRAPAAQRALATNQTDPLNQVVLSMISNVKKMESRFQTFADMHARQNDQRGGAAEEIPATKKLQKGLFLCASCS